VVGHEEPDAAPVDLDAGREEDRLGEHPRDLVADLRLLGVAGVARTGRPAGVLLRTLCVRLRRRRVSAGPGSGVRQIAFSQAPDGSTSAFRPGSVSVLPEPGTRSVST
jgi:hypothetical protein